MKRKSFEHLTESDVARYLRGHLTALKLLQHFVGVPPKKGEKRLKLITRLLKENGLNNFDIVSIINRYQPSKCEYQCKCKKRKK